MSEKLPQGWVKTTLGEIAEPSRERALPAEVPDMQYVGLEHIEPQTMRLLGYGYAHDARSSSVRFSKGDVLYAKMRPYLNKVWIADFDGLCSAEFLVFSKRDELNSQFLAMRLNAEDFVTFANRQVSGERPRVDFKKLSRFPIQLPPIAEQNRIVAKLDAALLGVERAEKAARRAHARLQRYRVAVLHAAVTGELTRYWREAHRKKESSKLETGDTLLHRLLAVRRSRWEEAELQRLRAAGKEPKDERWKKKYKKPVQPTELDRVIIPKDWTWSSADQCTTMITDGEHITPQRSESGTLLLSARNILDGRLSLEQVDYIPETEYERIARRLVVEQGDVLLSCSGSVGRSCVVPPNLKFSLVRSVAVLKPMLGMGAYLSFALRSPLLQGQISTKKTQTAQANIFQGKIKSLVFPLPPLAEQFEIVREVEMRLLAADRLAMNLEQQLIRARGTRQSLLREAFAGRLVPQDPNDKPASALLERIRAAREAEVQKPKDKRMPKSKSQKTRRLLLDVLREHNKPMTPEQLFMEAGYEHEFKDAKHSQEIVDRFYFELRELTEAPAKIRQRKGGANAILLEAIHHET